MKFFQSPVQKPPLQGGHIFRRITIARTIFKKGHTRNNLVKLFQILTCNFVDDIFKNFFISV